MGGLDRLEEGFKNRGFDTQIHSLPAGLRALEAVESKGEYMVCFRPVDDKEEEVFCHFAVKAERGWVVGYVWRFKTDNIANNGRFISELIQLCERTRCFMKNKHPQPVLKAYLDMCEINIEGLEEYLIENSIRYDYDMLFGVLLFDKYNDSNSAAGKILELLRSENANIDVFKKVEKVYIIDGERLIKRKTAKSILSMTGIDKVISSPHKFDDWLRVLSNSEDKDEIIEKFTEVLTKKGADLVL